MSLSEATLKALHQSLAEKSGLSLTRVSDAFRLSEQMARKKIYLSPYTIARLLGLLKDKRKPYTSSLDALARYLDFPDWYHLKGHLEGAERDRNRLREIQSLHNLHLALCTEKKRELYEALEALDNAGSSLVFHAEAAKVIGLYIRQYAQHRNNLLQWLATHPNGRRYFYETFVDEDNPGDYFRLALLDYYLPRCTKTNHKIFAQSFAFTRALYDTGKAPLPRSFTESYFKYRFSKNLHPHEAGRLWEVFFIYQIERLKDYEINQHLEEAARYIQELPETERCLMTARITRAFAFHKKADMLHRHSDWKFMLSDHVEKGRYCGSIYETISLFPLLVRESHQEAIRARIPKFDWEPWYITEYIGEMMVRSLYQVAFDETQKARNNNKTRERLATLVKHNRELWLRGFLALAAS